MVMITIIIPFSFSLKKDVTKRKISLFYFLSSQILISFYIVLGLVYLQLGKTVILLLQIWLFKVNSFSFSY